MRKILYSLPLLVGVWRYLILYKRMVGIKGNNNSKVLRPMSTQFLILVAFALIVVATVKTFGKGSWHAKATLDDHNNGVQHPQRQDIKKQKATSSEAANVKSANVADITVSKDVNTDIQDNNLIQFVFSSLDGKEGQEGEYITEIFFLSIKYIMYVLNLCVISNNHIE